MNPSDPDNAPVPGQSPSITNGSVPNEPQATKRSRKKLLIGVIIAIIVIGVGLGFFFTLHGNKSTAAKGPTGQPRGNNNPAGLSGPAVGSYAYVPACNVFKPVDQQDIFAGLSGSALVSASYADDGISAIDIGDSGVVSSCSREFGSDTAYSGVPLTFSVAQYPSESAAKTQFEIYSLSQDELDKANMATGAKTTVDTSPLTGAADSYYGTNSNSSYTLYKNKILTFSADIRGAVSVDAYKQALAKAIPTVEDNINNYKFVSTIPNDPGVFGKTIGDGTIYNPCKVYTGAIYRQATGEHDNPSKIDLTYNYNAADTFLSDTSSGWAQTTCTRSAYPGTANGVQDMSMRLEVFRSTAEANASIKAKSSEDHANSLSSSLKYKSIRVNGVGAYAAYLQPLTKDELSAISSFYVQKGPYVLVLSGTDVKSEGAKNLSPMSSEQYQAFAKLLVSNLQ